MQAKQWLLGFMGLILASTLQAQAPELTPRQYEQLIQLNDAYQEERYEEALKRGLALYDNPRGSDPQQAFMRVYAARILAQLYQQQNELVKATELLQATLQMTSEQLEDATLQGLRWLLIQIHLEQADYASAFSQLEIWWALEDEPAAEAIYLHAALLAQLERWQDAEYWILKAFDARKQPPDSWRALAVAIYQRQEKWLDAANQQALRLEENPERARLWGQLAQLQKLADLPDEALVTQELALRRGYLNRRQQEALGRELLNAEQPLRSALVFEQLIEATDEPRRRYLALAAQAWLQTRQPEETAKALERLARFTAAASDWRRLADWQYSQGQWQEAIQAWEQLESQLAEEGDKHRVQLMMATAYIELEDYSQARSILKGLLGTKEESSAEHWISYLDAL